jgi:hypothetical protein
VGDFELYYKDYSNNRRDSVCKHRYSRDEGVDDGGVLCIPFFAFGLLEAEQDLIFYSIYVIMKGFFKSKQNGK